MRFPQASAVLMALFALWTSSAATAQIDRIIDDVRNGNIQNAVQNVTQHVQGHQRVRPKPPVTPPVSPPTCPGTRPIDPVMPRPIVNPGIPFPVVPNPIVNPIMPNPGPPITPPPITNPIVPSPIVPTPIVSPPIPGVPIAPPVVVPPTPVVTPPVVGPPSTHPPKPDADKFKDRALRFVVQMPAQMPQANGTVMPDSNPAYQGKQIDEQSFLPNFSGAVIRPGVKVGDSWMGCTYTMGPYTVPGFGNIVPVTP